ncbi:aminoacyl-tRNA hydrolase [Dictyocaulus viviparus]|uniref:peptidyl-tRNA hydrolase n=1 Tax=Dictyocaulus viviparus TaxID=29172 RepID=A0A0D8Y371_DICVI|nr:aminoacyl-tRNA hydrolase [Dictyocaulus viviparus]
MSGRNLKFFRVGLPFFCIVVGGAYGLHFFQQVRYDFRRLKQQDANLQALRSDLERSGVHLRKDVTIESIQKELTNLDTESWENIRGPRVGEDNSEYLKAKAEQVEANKKARLQRRLELNGRADTRGSSSEVSLLLSVEPSNANLDVGDNPPEPDNASIRAERGSPTPSSVTVDNLPSLPDPVQLSIVPDPFGLGELPEVPIPPPLCNQDLPSSGTNNVLELPHPTDPQSQSQNSCSVNNNLYAQLIDLGFDDFTARLALIRTANIGVEEAVNWIIERSNPSDFEDNSSSSGGEDVEMGAANSTGEAGVQSSSFLGAFPQVFSLRGRTHKMVLVANMSLKMGTGKLAAQVGHATLGVYRQAMNSEAGRDAIEAWTRHGQVKIVVRGNSTEQLMDMCKAAKDGGCFYYLVQDAGYTQIPPGSRTVLGVFGTVEQVDAVTGGLKLL